MDLLLIIGVAALGAILASFIGVIAERLYTGQSWRHGRSHCNSCSRTLTAFDLVPIFSWSFARGRCRTCGARIPFLYTVSELILAVLFTLGYLTFGLTFSFLAFLAFLSVLAFIVIYDMRHTVVPTPASTLLIILGAILRFSLTSTFAALVPILLLAGSIGLGFLLLYLISRGRWMGLGDAPVALALSLMAGSQAFSGLLFSFWIGALVGIVILVARPKGHRMGIEVPFVPFLAAGFLLALFTGWNPLFL